MDSLSPEYVNIIWVGAAFCGGFLFKLLKLPPMIGFLVAGFVLNFLNLTNGSLTLESLADYGIILLLFTIGLKLDIKGLLRPEIWGGTTIHVLASVIFFSLALLALSTLGLATLAGLSLTQALLLGFALSFSSTIFAVKTLEERGEMSALHGRIAIGVLIMQDILAVLFVTFSKGEFPSPWALALPLFLLAVRPVFFYLIDHTGHGELLILAGFFVSVVVGATSFTLVGLKPDLGALVFGVLVSGHPRASEMSKALYGFKDLFLVAFFLKIGIYAELAWSQALLALGLVALLPVKSFFYLLVFTRFRLRARTAFLSTLILSNYSIFGLLVVSISIKQGWLGPEWLVILSLALTFSFILGAPLNSQANTLYDRLAARLARLETKGSHPDEVEVDLGQAAILVFGMGQVGCGAFDEIKQRHGNKVLGLDFRADMVSQHLEEGRQVILADATDFDFWQKVNLARVKLIMLAMPHHQANMFALKELSKVGFSGQVTATALFADELAELLAAGASTAYNIKAEAGVGYGQHVCTSLGCGLR